MDDLSTTWCTLYCPEDDKFYGILTDGAGGLDIVCGDIGDANLYMRDSACIQLLNYYFRPTITGSYDEQIRLINRLYVVPFIGSYEYNPRNRKPELDWFNTVLLASYRDVC